MLNLAPPSLCQDQAEDVAPPPGPSGLSTSYQRGVWPAAVGPALQALYGNLYASLPQFRANGGLDECHTYSVSRGAELLTLLVFRLQRGRVEVLNEVICLGEEELAAFARYVFEHLAEAQVIVLRAVHTPRYRGPYLCHQYDQLEDTIVTLPATAQLYLASLSKNTRRNVRRTQLAVQHELPGYTVHVAVAQQVEPAMVQSIVALNHARMAGKNKASWLDQEEERKLLVLAKDSGLVTYITVDGALCAGGIAVRTGDNFFLRVLAHDPSYDRYSLGFLCCYQMICECIARGGKEFHFLWGRYDYKRTFLGVCRELDHVLLYRNRSMLLRHAGLAWDAWRRATERRLMLRLQQRAQQPEAVRLRMVLTALRRWLPKRVRP